MKYEIKRTSAFKREVKLMMRRGKNLEKLLQIVALLADGIPLPPECRNHPLVGDYIGYWECHIEPDWLLVYTISEQYLILTLAKTGTHSDLFGK